MTYVSFTTCDQCGVKDEPTAHVFHFALMDVNSYTIGHLCASCARKSLPRADFNDRPA